MFRYPIQTSVMSTGIKTVAADLLVQSVVEKHSLSEMDWNRVAVFGCFGFMYLGCFQYWLYNLIYFRWFPGNTVLSTFKMVAFDQLIKHPFVYWPVFYTLQTFISERAINRETAHLVQRRYIENIKNDCLALWSVWIPAQTITFGIMPLHLRLPWIAAVSFGWCGVLSFMHGNYEKEEIIEKRTLVSSDGQ